MPKSVCTDHVLFYSGVTSQFNSQFNGIFWAGSNQISQNTQGSSTPSSPVEIWRNEGKKRLFIYAFVSDSSNEIKSWSSLFGVENSIMYLDLLTQVSKQSIKGLVLC